MTEPSKHDPPVGGFADPTRDIRLPPLPGRVLPPQWQTGDAASGPTVAASAAPPAPAVPAASAAPAAAAAPLAETPAAPPVEAPLADASAEPGPPTISDQPTDNLAPPQPRHKTLTFGAPGEEGGGPAAVPPHYSLPRVVPAPPRSKTWPWAVLIALPLIVIAVAAVLLIVLLRGT
jgi:hypothetical protein